MFVVRPPTVSTSYRLARCISSSASPMIHCVCSRMPMIGKARWSAPQSSGVRALVSISETSRSLCARSAPSFALVPLTCCSASTPASSRKGIPRWKNCGADASPRCETVWARAPSLEQRLDVFEDLLTEHLPPVLGLHPAVAQALHDLASAANFRG